MRECQTQQRHEKSPQIRLDFRRDSRGYYGSGWICTSGHGHCSSYEEYPFSAVDHSNSTARARFCKAQAASADKNRSDAVPFWASPSNRKRSSSISRTLPPLPPFSAIRFAYPGPVISSPERAVLQSGVAWPRTSRASGVLPLASASSTVHASQSANGFLIKLGIAHHAVVFNTGTVTIFLPGSVQVHTPHGNSVPLLCAAYQDPSCPGYALHLENMYGGL